MSMQSQPVPSFQQQNSRRRDNSARFHSSSDHQFSANHLEIVRMLNDDWKQTERELSEYKREKGKLVIDLASVNCT
ncbi:hypothetical protein HOLleu_18934 [Holothuria leucospilota]|uniref:Uncharacterized protein n=1 Tax=Holothuria leucospilota TaxID=206669 RepID=A0A9Q1H9H8_HOLLE|nr:hypothetical protein HOLleu_18934 [Holothuria leucospilota]